MANQIPLAYADVELQLASAVSIGDTSFTLSSANDDDGNALPAGKYCFTIDNGSTNKEYLLGQLNGTAVTSVVSVSRQGVETSGAVRAHRVGASAIISDFATIQRVADILRGQEELDGDNPVTYDAEPTLADRKELATVGYVLDQVSGGTVDFDNQIISSSDATAGETISAGDLVFFQTSDQEWYQADADVAAEVNNVQLGIALGSGTDGVSITGGVQISGVYTTSGLTAGDTYYVSNTPGQITNSAGTTERVVGVALSATKLLMIPVNPQSLNAGEKAALAGDTTPDATNTFITKGKQVTAGATISGATLPVPVYQNKTDNEFYACDANDTAAMKFVGFAISNGTDGNSMYVQFSGVVSGFTGLSEGEKYYVQDTAGTIGTSPGTYEILVGVAISETELVIQRGKRYASGTLTMSGDTVITTGFRPSCVRVIASYGSGGATSNAMSSGGWTVQGGNDCAYIGSNASNNGIAGVAATAWHIQQGNASAVNSGSVDTITDTGFTLNESATAVDVTIFWEAEGEF